MYSSVATDPSNFVSTFNTSFFFILIVSVILLTGLTITMLYFIFRYNRKKNKVAAYIEGNNRLEIAWTVIPTLLALVMFYTGWTGWKPMESPPKDAMNITGMARMWNFSFLYENGKQSPDLIVPVNKPVKVKLVSLDVNHSMFIPEFRIKSDIIPGREKQMWFIPQREGQYELFCAEYCGLRHSYMNAKVKVLAEADFDKWYIDTTAVIAVTAVAGPGSEGQGIMQTQGCFACHSVDGSKIIGPSYLNLFGEQQTVIRDGKEVILTVDEDYVRRSILNPNSEVVKGYPRGLMQSYESTLSQDDISKIIEYLKVLSEK